MVGSDASQYDPRMGRREGRAGLRSAGRLDRYELAVLVLFAAVSVWLIVLNLWTAAHHHLVWTGIDGVYPIDQLQYLAWVRDASGHVLVSDLFVHNATPHDYLQPMIAISGGLTAVGLAPWFSLLVWKPIALAATFLAVRGYCGRLLLTRTQRNLALLLGLFAATFNVVDNEWLPFMSWGYPFDLLSLACLIGCLIAYDQSRTRATISPLALLLGALTAWLHPWQGELLIVVLAACEGWRWVAGIRAGVRPRLSQARQPLARLSATSLFTALPLAYYAALGQFDPVWRSGQAASQQSWPLGMVLPPLIPLLVLGLPAYRLPARGFIGLTARAWPLGALVVWSVNQTSLGAWSIYAWVGITVPLAILAVEGTQLWGLARVPHHRWLAALAIALLTLPGAYLMLKKGKHETAPGPSHQNLITRSESRAMAYLAADRHPGSVLSPWPTGDAVPAETGRHTYVGDNRWSIRYTAHDAGAWNLVHGWLDRRKARALVRSSRARFILAPCGSKNLHRDLGGMIESTRQFGCLTVYRVA
jgi:hypothetical protein